jgi:GMP synthase (glutamine-hydrolysing)
MVTRRFDGQIMLVQAREADDPMLVHEYECFLKRCGVPSGAMETLNLAAEPPDPARLEGIDVVMVGGSGDFSLVTGGFDWHEPMLELMRTIVRRRQPMFASCFGFQAIVQALGGTLRSDPKRAELGTFEMTLTDAGRADPLFSRMPERFDAQLGHNDSAVELPDELVCLAGSERCAMQAVRVEGAPIVATQFHPELTWEDNMERFMRYIMNYKDADESVEDAHARGLEIHRPSPHCEQLLPLFLEHCRAF